MFDVNIYLEQIKSKYLEIYFKMGFPGERTKRAYLKINK